MDRRLFDVRCGYSYDMISAWFLRINAPSSQPARDVCLAGYPMARQSLRQRYWPCLPYGAPP